MGVDLSCSSVRWYPLVVSHFWCLRTYAIPLWRNQWTLSATFLLPSLNLYLHGYSWNHTCRLYLLIFEWKTTLLKMQCAKKLCLEFFRYIWVQGDWSLQYPIALPIYPLDIRGSDLNDILLYMRGMTNLLSCEGEDECVVSAYLTTTCLCMDHCTSASFGLGCW